MLGAGLVVGKHAHAILHSENLVIHSTVVAILVAQVVETLAQFGDELILLTGSDLNSCCLYSSKQFGESDVDLIAMFCL